VVLQRLAALSSSNSTNSKLFGQRLPFRTLQQLLITQYCTRHVPQPGQSLVRFDVMPTLSSLRLTRIRVGLQCYIVYSTAYNSSDSEAPNNKLRKGKHRYGHLLPLTIPTLAMYPQLTSGSVISMAHAAATAGGSRKRQLSPQASSPAKRPRVNAPRRSHDSLADDFATPPPKDGN